MIRPSTADALPRRLAGTLLVSCLLPVAPLAAQTSPTPPPATPDLWPSSLPQAGSPWMDLVYRFDGGERGDLASARLGLGYQGFLWLTGHYGRASAGVPDDEWEVAARLVPLSASAGAPVEVALTAAWNEAAGSADGELMVGVPLTPRLMVTGAIRRFADQIHDEDGAWAAGAGVEASLPGPFRLGGDAVITQDVDEVVWGASLSAVLPRTPASVALELGNGLSTTLQGSSTAGDERIGLRLRIPLDPRSWVRAAGSAGNGPRVGESDVPAGDTVDVEMGADGFAPATMTVPAGSYVRWRNGSDEVHSATAEDDGWTSPLLAPGESYARVFPTAGEHAYRCRLHPDERAVLTVTDGGD